MFARDPRAAAPDEDEAQMNNIGCVNVLASGFSMRRCGAQMPCQALGLTRP
jgi:hypothetical protein